MAESHTLLAHMVSRLTSQGENAATEALAYILNKSAPCRDALIVLLGDSDRVPDALARFETQVTAPDGTRPDMVGYDRTETTRVIVEAKFWTSLRDEQVTGYLQQFEHDGPGVLLFIAPERRLQTLWAKIRRVIGTENGGGERVDGGVGLRRAAIEGSEKRLALVSWTLLLERLGAAAQDAQVRSELEQLRGLAVSQDQAAFLPLHGEEFAASLPRRLLQYRKIVDDAVDAHGVPDGWMTIQGLRPAATSSYSGRYFRFIGIPADLFLCIDYELWGRQGETPIWLGISGGVPINLEALPTEQGSTRGWSYVPIRLKTRAEYDEVLADVVHQVKSIRDLACATAG